jgi:hypothetical protein
VANEDAILKEVDHELAEERQWAMYRKYAPAILAAGAALVIGVAALQFWNARQQGAANEQALEYQQAMALLDENETEGRKALAEIFEKGDSGYGVLSQFQRAASFARAGERDAAITAYAEIYHDAAAPRRMREFARIKAAYLALAEGRDAVLAHLGDLVESQSPFAHNANEAAGLAALEAGDYETALAIFRRLSIEAGASAAVRGRAQDFAALALAAKAGVDINAQVNLEDILEAVGEAPAAPDVLEGDRVPEAPDADDPSPGEPVSDAD